MIDDLNGICPNCAINTGPVGEPCTRDLCSSKEYHFIPKAWFEAAREFSKRKRKPLDSMLGRNIDRYLLAGKLGEGGMGAVYVAFQKPLHREVALKLISGIEINDSTLARFEREARAISVLDHPNIVKLHDYGIGHIEYQVPYMALEYVRHGRTLRRALDLYRNDTGFDVMEDAVISIFRQILNALASAHSMGIVHRDMKPDNVLIAPVEGNPFQVKVLDFGLAKAVAEVTGFEDEVSRTGQLLGTPHFMAPEQVGSDSKSRVDERTDLHAVAVMIFEVLTGTRPFEGDSALSILTKKTDPTYDPLDIPDARKLPDQVKAFLKRGLAADMDARFPNARAMLASMEEVLSNHRLVAPPTGPHEPISSQDRPRTPPSPANETQGNEAETRITDIAASPTGLDGDSGIKVPDDHRFGRPYAGKKTGLLLPLVMALALAGVVSVYFLVGKQVGIGGEPDDAVSGVAASSIDTGEQDASVGHEPDTVSMQKQTPDTALLDVTSDLKPKGTEDDAQGVGKEPPPPTAVEKTFTIVTTPIGARIEIDDVPAGRSPVEYRVLIGRDKDLERRLRIKASAPGFRDTELDLKVIDAIGVGNVVLELGRKYRPKPGNRPTPHPPKPPEKKENRIIEML